MTRAIVTYGCGHGIPRAVRVDAGSETYERRMLARTCRYCPGDAPAGKREHAAARKAGIPAFGALIEAAGIRSAFRADDDGRSIRVRTMAVEQRKRTTADKRASKRAERTASKRANGDAAVDATNGDAADGDAHTAASDAPVVARAGDADKRAALRRDDGGDAATG